MDAIFRAACIYFALLILFRVAGRRSLADVTTFDLVLLMIIGEATQQGLLGDDFSVTNAILVILTLIAIDISLSLLKRKYARVELLIDGTPTILVEHGKLLCERIREARLREEDIMMSARMNHGIESIEQVKYAILETNGKISIIPAQSSTG